MFSIVIHCECGARKRFEAATPEALLELIDSPRHDWWCWDAGPLEHGIGSEDAIVVGTCPICWDDAADEHWPECE
jgi:hypothetical protein